MLKLMWLLLPVATVLGIYILYEKNIKNPVKALANTWLTVVAFIWITTELLSICEIWTRTTVIITWGLLLMFLMLKVTRRKVADGFTFDKYGNIAMYNKIKKNRGWLLLFTIYFAFVFITAVLSAPNNFDVLKYHLPRIEHWIQNKSVWYYATGVDRQIRYPSLAEYMVSQILILTGYDRLTNLIQSVSFFTSAVMIFGIARRIGTSVRFSFFSAMIYCMMPMAVAQTYNAQTDNIAGMFLLVYIYLLLDFIEAEKLPEGRKGIETAVRLAAGVMFGYLCKPTICFVMVVFFCWMLVVRLRKKDSFKILAQYAVVGGVTAILLCAPLLAKNYFTYFRHDASVGNVAEIQIHSPVVATLPGIIVKTEVLAEEMKVRAEGALAPDHHSVGIALRDPTIFILTCAKNIGRNSAVASLPIVNSLIEAGIHKLEVVFGVHESDFFLQNSKDCYDRDRASAPGIMFLGLFCWIAVFSRLSRVDKRQFIYMLCASVGFIVTCGLMGYSEFRTRYLVGTMAVMCPMFGMVLDNIRVTLEYKKCIISSVLTLASIGVVNTLSIEIGYVADSFFQDKIDVHFCRNPLADAYRMVTEHISNNKWVTVGLEGDIEQEYVLWTGIESLERIEYMNVQDPGLARYEDQKYLPECVYRETEKEIEIGDIRKYHGQLYVCDWVYEEKGVYYTVYVCNDVIG